MRVINKELFDQITFEEGIHCASSGTVELYFAAPKELLDVFGYEAEECPDEDMEIVAAEIKLEYPEDHPDDVSTEYSPTGKYSDEDEECLEDFDWCGCELSEEEIKELMILAEEHELEDCE